MGEAGYILRQQSIVEGIKSNDPLVLKQLYKENYTKVEVYILKNSGSVPQAKDIFQEAYLAMYQNVKLGQFHPDNDSALSGYLFRIAKNKWIDHLRSARHKKTVRVQEELPKEPISEAMETDLENEINNELIEATMKALTSLGEECRKILKRFYYEKLSLREIAAQFNIGEASARNKKYRCIQRLRKIVIENQ